MRRLPVLLAFCALAFAQRKPFDVNALLQLKRIADPQISPDGKLVAFQVQTVDNLKKDLDAYEDIGDVEVRTTGSNLDIAQQLQQYDSLVQSKPEAKRVKIRFDSAEYFDLLRQHPEAAAWLAMGSKMQLVLGDAIYEIIDE